MYLIGHVEIDQEVLLLANGAQLLPLGRGGVNTGWVMGTGVKDDTGAIWHIGAEIIVTALGVETTR